jgi:mono/diheme cytochrome c family protein
VKIKKFQLNVKRNKNMTALGLLLLQQAAQLPAVEPTSHFSSVGGWLVLFLIASGIIVGLGKVSSRISSAWILGILVGFVGLASIFSLFVCTAFNHGPGPKMLANGKPAPRTEAELNAKSASSSSSSDAQAAPVAKPVAGKALFEQKCQACHIDKCTTIDPKVYTSESKVYEVMAGMLKAKDPKTGQSADLKDTDVFEIQSYLVSTVQAATPAASAPAEAPATTQQAPATSAQQAPAATQAAPATPATAAVVDPLTFKPLFTTKCNACHSMNMVKSKINKGNAQTQVTRMQQKPGSKISVDEAKKIISYLQATL